MAVVLRNAFSRLLLLTMDNVGPVHPDITRLSPSRLRCASLNCKHSRRHILRVHQQKYSVVCFQYLVIQNTGNKGNHFLYLLSPPPIWFLFFFFPLLSQTVNSGRHILHVHQQKHNCSMLPILYDLVIQNILPVIQKIQKVLFGSLLSASNLFHISKLHSSVVVHDQYFNVTEKK